MEVLGVFRHTLKVELLLGTFIGAGIEKGDIIAVSLKNPESRTRKSANQTVSGSRSELAFILATAWAVIGAGIGYRLYLGPVIWGIGASMAGFLSGYMIQTISLHAFSGKKNKPSAPGVILIIRCPDNQRQHIEQLMMENEVLGLTVFSG
jgi:hypothetical protein